MSEWEWVVGGRWCCLVLFSPLGLIASRFHMFGLEPVHKKTPSVQATPPPCLREDDPACLVRHLLDLCHQGRGIEYLVDWEGNELELKLPSKLTLNEDLWPSLQRCLNPSERKDSLERCPDPSPYPVEVMLFHSQNRVIFNTVHFLISTPLLVIEHSRQKWVSPNKQIRIHLCVVCCPFRVFVPRL